jgi:hypothetical protein
MSKPTPHYFRQAILTWLNTAEEAELIEVLELIQVLLSRRRLRGPTPPAPPPSEGEQEK